MRKLSGEFYYLGCFDQCGERIPLKVVRQNLKAGFDDVTAVDIAPGCVAHPYRVFLLCRPFEAQEVLQEHCQKYPTGRIARMFLAEVAPDEAENADIVVYHKNKILAPDEDWIVAVERVKDAALLVTEAGGEYRRLARRMAPEYDLELVWENGSAWVYGWAPTYNRPNGVGELRFPAAPQDLAPALQAAKAWELAWQELTAAQAVEKGA